MRARGDLTVLHEPFMYHYYLHRSERLFPDFDPDPDHPQSYADIRADILSKAEHGPVFFKDMAYYVAEDLPGDRPFLAAMTHAFLVRDPTEAILSYHKRDPDFTSVELGIEAQARLHDALAEAGQSPLVLTADQLRHDPTGTLRRYWHHVGLPYAEHAFSWDDSVPEGWESVVGWHGDVLRHGEIRKPEKARDIHADLAALGAPLTDYERHHRPFYEHLAQIADRQAKEV